MWRPKNKRARQTQPAGQTKQRRPALIMALEPRMVFDGAAVATAHAAHAENLEQLSHHVSALSSVAHRNSLSIDPQRWIPSLLHPVTATVPEAATPSGPAVVFIDSRVENSQSLLQGVAAGTEVVYLNPNQDGLQQIAGYLAAHHEVGSVEIIAHGTDAELQIGSTDLTAANIDSYAKTLGAIGSNLKQGADILVYACDVAADAKGVAFVDTLAALTGHNVAASSNIVGAGGGWDLDVTTGDITAVPVLSRQAEALYGSELVTINTVAELNAAIAADANDSTNDTITITGNIAFASTSDTITVNHPGTGSLTINGGGFTINGNHDGRVITINSGSVTLENVTITNGLLSGAGGGFGSLNGGSAKGAGIYVGGSSVVSIKNVTVLDNDATGGGGGGSGVGYSYGGGGGSGILGVGGGAGGAYNSGRPGGSAINGVGGTGGNAGTVAQSGIGGSTTGGTGGEAGGGFVAGGSGATAGAVGGGGGGAGGSVGTIGGSGGLAAGGMYIGGTAKVYLSTSTFSHNYGAAGGGGGGYKGVAGNGGNGSGAITVGATGTLEYQSSSVTFTSNQGTGGHGGSTYTGEGGGTAGTNGSSSGTTGIQNLGVAGHVISNYVPPPTVSAGFISVSGSTGTGGDYKIGDTVTATWNNSGSGDNNSASITGVTFNFSQFGGGSAVVAVDVSNVWTATYTITSGAIDAATRNVAVTATDGGGSTTTTGASNVTVDNEQPVVTAGNISLSGGTGAGGAFKIGDIVTATWNNSGTGDNNTDTINAGGVTMNLSQFGGGSAVTATNSGGVWTATYTITSGAIDTTNAHAAVTVTDHAGNATTTSGSAVTVDDIQPVVTAGNISLSGGTGAGGAFKIGDTVTATWNDSGTGDNNTDTINAGGVTMNFSQLGGGSAVVATDVANVWAATYTITSGAIDTTNAHVAVTATDHVGNAKTTSGGAVTVDDIQPVVTAGNISLSGGTGTGGAFKIGDTVTATWNDSGTGDNNTDTINAGGVTMNFSQFGGGEAVVATDVANVWTATYTITSGAIDTATAHVAVTATDSVGNAATTSSSAVTVDNEQPVVTTGNISLSGATGTDGVFKVGDTVTATWNDSETGDNNTDTLNAGGVTMNFSQFGGGSAVVATNSEGVWTATYTITSGAIDTATAHVAVTATDHVGNATTTSSSAAAVDDIAPTVTSPNISLSGGTGTSGAFKIGDTVTATWNDSGTGDNNTDTINAGGVTMNFSQFGGGEAVVATDVANVWTATYTITSGAIDTATAHVAVTATDQVGNATTTSSSAVTVDNEQPVVTAGNISLSGATGTDGVFKVGDTVTATWDNSGAGDNNTDTINAGGVTMDFSQFGGSSAVTATNSGGVWTATYTITAGAIDTDSAHVAVTATDHVGNATTTSGAAVSVDDIAPTVTSPNISLSGGTGTSGAFKIGDTVTATWNDSGTGDNNTDTINAGGVTMNFSQFGGGSAVVATDVSNVWTATYTITSGAIDTATAHVAVTATDQAGNATTTSSSAVTVDDIQPVVTSDNISLSGATGTDGVFKVGDTVTATWNDSGTGDNNADTINAGGVTMDFSQFGGGSAVTATNSGGVWTATYTITAGAVDTDSAHVAVTATDYVGNATTTSSNAVAVDDIQPIVTAPNISLSGGTGTDGAFKIGDTVTATWNDSETGDNNTDTINAGGVTMNFSQFGGGAAVTATDVGGVWTATYTITSGAIDTATAHVAVTATDSVGNATTTSSGAVTVDDIQPVVTSDNISLSGATGTGGAFKIGDTVTATWDDSGTGDNNTDTINAGGVTMNFSQFGGGSAVTATNSGGVWTATYTITSGAIDTSTAQVAVTATDHVGNATTMSSSAAAVDDIQPIVTSDNISLSGGTGAGGAFKVGDTVTATWNDSGTGDSNTDTINAGGVTMDFSQFGGGSAVTATNSGGVWTATYTISAGAIDTDSAHVAVTATDHVGNATTTSGAAVTVDDIAPIVTAPNISLSGGTGTGGAFKIGDTVTATWNDSGTGDNNTDTINAGGVTMNFSQFGGGSAVTATDAGGVWTATYTITSGAIDTATAHVAVTATDQVGNATTTSSSAVTLDDIQPIVTSDNISLSGATGTDGVFKIGDTVTVTWNDSVTGDNNTDTINAGGVTMDFSQFGGGSAVTATNSGGVWTATYTITSGAVDTANAHVAVTATDHVGNATTTSSSAVAVDDIQPIVTPSNINLSGSTGTGGAFKIGDTVTATWNDSVIGDNNTDTINAGGVTMDFSPFGGSSAVTATNSGGVWTATYTITSGSIDTTTAHVAVTATDHVGNATTTSSSAFTVDNTPVTIISIAPSGPTTNTGGSESFTVTFSTAVTGVTASDFTVATSGVTYSNIVNPPTTTDGVHWAVVVAGADGYGTLSLGMTSSGVVADPYGNVVSLPDGGFTAATEPSNDTGYTVHGTPVLTAGSGNSGFTEANPYSGNSPIAIDSGITLTPGNSSTMTQAVISFTGATYQAGQDVLSLGSGSYGNITGGFDTATGTLTLTSAGNTATAAQWQAALDAVSYNDTSALPSTTPRSFAFVVTDSNGLSSTPITETMSVAHTDQSPVVSTSAGSTSYVVNAAATPIDGSIAVTEADGTALSSVVVTIGSGAQSGDALSFTANAGTMGNIAAGAYDSTTHTLTLTSTGSSASLAQWDAALEAVEFATSGADGNRTISFVATNADSETSNTAAKTIDVGPSSPTLTPGAGNTGFTETDPYTANTPVTIDSGITLTPGNSSTMTSATVSFAGSTYHSGQDVLSLGSGGYGNITSSFDTTTGTLTLTSSGNTATAAQWQAALDAIAYDDTAALPSTTARSFNFTITDSNSLSSSAITETVAVTHTDQSPVVTTSSGSIDYVGGASAATIDGSIAVGDSDNGTQSSATVSITTGFHSGDTLAFNNTNPTLYGNIGASYSAGTGVLILTSSEATATDAQWANALSAITFSAATTVSPGNRTISFVINDGTKNSAAATDTVDVLGPPIVTTDSGSAAFVAGDNVTSTPVAVDNGGSFAVTDASSTTLQSAAVSITGNFHSGEDVLAFTNTGSATYGDVSASYDAITGVLTLTSAGGATLAQWNNALEAVTYTDTAITPDNATRTISFGVTDGNANASNIATRTVTVTDTDQTPIVTTAGGTTSYEATASGVTIDAGITVSDRDNTTQSSGTVSITSGFDSGDVLAFSNTNATQYGNIVASYNAGTGVLTLTSAGAAATDAQWANALSAVTFTSNSTSYGNRTVSFVTNDGTENSAAATDIVNVTAPPSITTDSGSAAFVAADNTVSTPVAIDSGLTVVDPSTSTLQSATVSITGNFHSGEDVLAFTNTSSTIYGNIAASYDSGTGVLTLISTGATATTEQWQAALQGVTYTDTAVTPATSTRTIDFTATDANSVVSNIATRTVTVADTDQTPIVTTTGGLTGYLAGESPVAIDSGVTVSDRDNTTQSSGTVSITSGFNSGDVLAFSNTNATLYGNIVATYNTGTGMLNLTSSGATATDAQWQNALDAVTFSTGASATPGNRTVSFTINDGAENSSSVTRTVSVIGPPTITTDAGSASFVAGDNLASTPVILDSGIAVADPGASTLASATVSITGNFHSGEDVLAFSNNGSTMGNIAGSYNAGTGILTLTSSGATATLAQWQAALDSVAYDNTAITPNTAARTVSLTVADVIGTLSNTATRTVTVQDTDQTPTISTTPGIPGYVAGLTPIVVDSGIVVGDRDNTTLASATAAISGGFRPGDQLSFTPANSSKDGNITASYDATTGVLTLNSSGAAATLAQWQAALDSIQFSAQATASPGNRTVSFVVNDGTESSATATKTVACSAQAFAPPVVESSPETLGSVAQEPVLATPHEPSSPIVLQELSSQPISSEATDVQTVFFSSTSLGGGLLGLSDSGSRTQSGIDVPTWLQPTSPGWLAQTQQSLTEQFDVASGETFSITLVPSSTPADGETQYTPAENDVQQADGRPLPAWMHYDVATGVLSGVAPKGARHEMRLVVTLRDSSGRITHREIVIDFGGRTTSGTPDGSRLLPQDSLAVPTPALRSKPSLAEQFSRQRAALHVSLPPHAHSRRSA